MAITRISQSSVKEGLEKFPSFYGGLSSDIFGNYDSIATATVGAGGAASIEFGAGLPGGQIPQNYQHLQIRMVYKDSAVVNDVVISIRANGDSGSNYSWHSLVGTGLAASVGSGVSQNQAIFGYELGSNSSTNIFSVAVLDILNYKDTSKNTTFRSFTGADRNGFGEVRLFSGAWYNTAAINSLTILPGQTSFPQYCTAALYGIKAP